MTQALGDKHAVPRTSTNLESAPVSATPVTPSSVPALPKSPPPYTLAEAVAFTQPSAARPKSPAVQQRSLGWTEYTPGDLVYRQGPAYVRPAEEQRASSIQPTPDTFKRDGRWIRVPLSPRSLDHLTAERATWDRVPSTFGVPGGIPIRNIGSILDDTWHALGSKTRPAIVYVMAKGVDCFAHAAVAYRRPDGELTLMNIVGKVGQQLCNFMPLEEYLFGVNELTHFNEHGIEMKRPAELGGPWKNPEGGAYHRDHELFVIWDWPQEKLDAMHAYYEEVNRRQRDRGLDGSRFRLIAGDWRDWYDRLTGRDLRESGNCSVWTSRGLQVAGVVDHFSMWPKETAVRILRGIGRDDPDNFDIVSVPWITHARRTHQADARLIAKLPFVPKKLDYYPPKTTIMIAPTQLLSDSRLTNLSLRAAARIVVDPGTTVGHIERQSRALSRL